VVHPDWVDCCALRLIDLGRHRARALYDPLLATVDVALQRGK
jgi:hypothetical protein